MRGGEVWECDERKRKGLGGEDLKYEDAD